MELRGAVVVVTGASSGIGRATALAFARAGAHVVAAARRREPLEEVAALCRDHGPGALAVPTDVADEAAVHELAARAFEAFGRIDVWVNNAGVAAWGRFETAPPEILRRVVDVNLFGVFHGARAALPHFRAGGRGVLINVASMVGKMAFPYYTSYVASKFAVVGFSEMLREELLGSGIDVVTIMPGAVDTPLFEHGANYLGRGVKPPKPLYAPDDVARAIVESAVRPRRERFVGASGRVQRLVHAVAPRLFERMARRLFERDHLMATPAPATAGNVLDPMERGVSADGGWRRAA